VGALKREIEELKQELSKTKKKHEEDIAKQLKKFEVIESQRK
jgi:hypothetical protein